MSSRIEESKADAGTQGGSTMAALRVPQFPLAFGLAGTYQLSEPPSIDIMISHGNRLVSC